MKPKVKVLPMFLAVMLQASMIFGIVSCSVNDNNGGHESLAADTIVYRFASQEEGRRLKLANTSYFNSLSQNDLDWKTFTIGQTLAGYKAIAAEQIMDFTDEEKWALTQTMHDIEARCAELGIKLPCEDEIIFIKSAMADESDAGAYTHKNEIYLHEISLESLVCIYQNDPEYSAEELELGKYFIQETVVHEIFHIITRSNAQFRQQMYNLIGFTVMDHEVEFGPTVRELLQQNPDVERYDNYAEFTIAGQKRRCILIATYPGSYNDDAVGNPDFFILDYAQAMLVPIDEPDTMIPIEATDLYDVMGSNTHYTLAAEECIADNFAFLIIDGMDGYYDYSEEDDNIIFVPYDTPQLIRNIYDVLKLLTR